MQKKIVRSKNLRSETKSTAELLLTRVRDSMDAIDILADTPPELIDACKSAYQGGARPSEDGIKINILYHRGEIDQNEFLLLASYFAKVNAESLLYQRTPNRRVP